jgi:hypothetical protein
MCQEHPRKHRERQHDAQSNYYKQYIPNHAFILPRTERNGKHFLDDSGERRLLTRALHFGTRSLSLSKRPAVWGVPSTGSGTEGRKRAA